MDEEFISLYIIFILQFKGWGGNTDSTLLWKSGGKKRAKSANYRMLKNPTFWNPVPKLLHPPFLVATPAIVGDTPRMVASLLKSGVAGCLAFPSSPLRMVCKSRLDSFDPLDDFHTLMRICERVRKQTVRNRGGDEIFSYNNKNNNNNSKLQSRAAMETTTYLIKFTL